MEIWKPSNYVTKTTLELVYPKKGPKTRDCWWDIRPETRYPSHRWDPGHEIRDPEGRTPDPTPVTLKVDFQKIFSVFSENRLLGMNSWALCVYVYFKGFSLPYHTAYTLLIIYQLNELLFPSCCKGVWRDPKYTSENFFF